MTLACIKFTIWRGKYMQPICIWELRTGSKIYACQWLQRDGVFSHTIFFIVFSDQYLLSPPHLHSQNGAYHYPNYTHQRGLLTASLPVNRIEMLGYVVLILSGAHQHTNRILFSTKKAPINGERNYYSTVVLCCIELF